MQSEKTLRWLGSTLCSKTILHAIMLIVLSGMACAQVENWRLVWSDEFDGQVNSAPDPSKWTYDLGNGGPRNPGWGNFEKEDYTSLRTNIFQDGKGHLVIRVLEENGRYTSARIKTDGKFSFKYGKVEARIKLPFAAGIWPAFWMLGANFSTEGWPSCGEIDIMENFGVHGRDSSRNHGTIHGPGYAATGITSAYNLPAGQVFSDGFHVFSIDWRPGSIDFIVDGASYFKATPNSLPPKSRWVFDAPFFLVLNVAVGGYPAPVGYPDRSTIFPQEMLVDYIRVYQIEH